MNPDRREESPVVSRLEVKTFMDGVNAISLPDCILWRNLNPASAGSINLPTRNTLASNANRWLAMRNGKSEEFAIEAGAGTGLR